MALFQLTALAVFYALFIGRSVGLHHAGERVLVLGKGKRGGRALLERVFMAALLVWSGEIVLRSLGSGRSLFPAVMGTPLFASRPAEVLGAAAIVAGLALFAAALWSFGRSWRIGIDHDRPGALVTRGIFAYTRNPIFLFMDLYFTGTWLLQRDLFFLLFAVAAVGGIHFQILQEERFLATHYGEAYRRYRQDVPRYVGLLRYVAPRRKGKPDETVRA
jgi:protein-S-isoprenylcysteine O-methyltransferase Ste14